MRRREFMAGFGSAVAWPAVARAQQPAMPVIGFVSGGSADTSYGSAFRRALAKAATSMVRTRRWSTTGWKASTIACRP